MRSTEPIKWQFGPLRTREGVIFRLWGPAAETVSLLLDDEPPIPMNRDAEGWWRSQPLKASAGVTYRFLINQTTAVPDPAARQQLEDVHGPSLLTEPDTGHPPGHWKGRPWEETVIYEVHAGTAGGFLKLAEDLPRLADLGITAIELMPVADFPGARNWGYDGVLPFAPDSAYGSPADLVALVTAAHDNNMSILLDVVYNHFGPDGNYLHLYAPQFYDTTVDTPWGAAIDFTVPHVRRFFIENALYWIQEIGFDGLRLDAVHAIHDPSSEHILTELAATVRNAIEPDRHVHLVLENDRNESRFLGSEQDRYTAQWNDDIHHAWHVLLTGENHGYYHGFSHHPEKDLLKALTTGFVYQGENGIRGEPSGHLSPTRFIAFLQNHDQIGNRAFGERLINLTEERALRTAVASQLLAPQIPLLFMGEPWGAREPYQFFCDFGEDLTRAVREGRRREFGLDELPDPAAEETFQRSIPGPGDDRWYDWYRNLLALRVRYLVPILHGIGPGASAGGGDRAAVIVWPPGWIMELNLSPRARPLPATAPAPAVSEDDRELLFDGAGATGTIMPPWTIRIYRSKS